MKKFLFLLVLFFFVFPVNVAGGQILPLLGTNCGVPDHPTRNVCCYGDIQKFAISEEIIKKAREIPIAGKIIPGFLDLINIEIDTLPFFVPIIADVLPVPTLGKLKNLTKEIPACIEGASPNKNPSESGCECVRRADYSLYSLLKLCDNVSSKEQRACKDCLNNNGIYTGLFCVKGNLSTFIKETIFSFSIGLAGIIALFCIIYSAFQIQTSQGNAEKIKKAQELLTSCIMGLMLIIFSVFILRLIGVDILKIPGFGK